MLIGLGPNGLWAYMADYLAGLTCGKIFIHSENDDIVPFSHGKRLFEAAPPKALWIPSDGHTQAFMAYRETYGPKLLNFLKTALKIKPDDEMTGLQL